MNKKKNEQYTTNEHKVQVWYISQQFVMDQKQSIEVSTSFLKEGFNNQSDVSLAKKRIDLIKSYLIRPLNYKASRTF